MIKGLKEYIEDYQGGGKCLVMGTGPSLKTLPTDFDMFSISVNDIGDFRRADTIIIVDRFNSFQPYKKERMGYTVPFLCPTEQNEWSSVVKGDIYSYTFAGYDVKNIETCTEKNQLVIGHTSTFCALELAYLLGYNEIGVLGVDMSVGHAMNPDDNKVHPLKRILNTVDREFKNLYNYIHSKGVNVYNLSQESAITAFPKINLKEFL